MRPSISAQTHRQRILDAAARHGARNLRVFGSAARGDDRDGSDLDLLVDLDADRSLWDLGEFVADVRDIVHCEVQAVTSDGLHRLLRDRILAEARPL